MRRIIAVTFLIALLPVAGVAAELKLSPVKVADDVYAVVGDLGGQTYKNDGLNANLGFVVGRDGVLVINTGPTKRVAEALHRAIRTVTPKPVKWVVNVNSQNHYWHGNATFQTLGAKVIAHKAADAVMRETGETQRQAVATTLKEKAQGTTLAFPTELVEGKRELTLGKTKIEILPTGPAHTPGDVSLWLPAERVLFSGDIVYTERLLAINPGGKVANWVKSFDMLAALNPKALIPGHGNVTTVDQARRETRDYLEYLRTETKKHIDQGASVDEAVDKIDQGKFKHLKNFDTLARRNAYNLYLEMMADDF
jgi:glyoxylase-like metal-dependent hydrolase (beta-lactamase superfamily II)